MYGESLRLPFYGPSPLVALSTYTNSWALYISLVLWTQYWNRDGLVAFTRFLRLHHIVDEGNLTLEYWAGPQHNDRILVCALSSPLMFSVPH